MWTLSAYSFFLQIICFIYNLSIYYLQFFYPVFANSNIFGAERPEKCLNSGCKYLEMYYWALNCYFHLFLITYIIYCRVRTLRKINNSTLFKKSLFHRCKSQFWHAITGDWLKLIAKFSIPFCSEPYPLSKTFFHDFACGRRSS